MYKNSIVNIFYQNRRIQARLADNFFSRLRGLLWSKPINQSEGLLIVPCNSIHTIGMQYAIDIVFLSPDFQVVHIATYCQPSKFFKHKQAKYTLVLLAGQASVHDFKVGSQLSLSKSNKNVNE
ncbi:MAG: DUF192 domain-containing protein [Methylotenera sp.]|jgi:uncharacterized protein